MARTTKREKVAKLNKSQKDSNELNQFGRSEKREERSESEDVDDFSSDPVNNPHLSLVVAFSSPRSFVAHSLLVRIKFCLKGKRRTGTTGDGGKSAFHFNKLCSPFSQRKSNGK
jgi:hypothetical protein